MEELLIDHRKGFDGNLREIVTPKIQGELPGNLITGEHACDLCHVPVLDAVFRLQVEREDRPIQPLVESCDDLLRTYLRSLSQSDFDPEEKR